MPVPYRRYFIDKLSKTIDAQNKEMEKVQKTPNQKVPKMPSKFRK